MAISKPRPITELLLELSEELFNIGIQYINMLSGCWRAVPCCFNDTVFYDGFWEYQRSLCAIVLSKSVFAPNSLYNTCSNQRLWECFRRRIKFYTGTLNDFSSWLSTFFNNNRGFTERYFSDKVHAFWLKRSRTTLRDGARKFDRTEIFTSAFKYRAKYSHINLYNV